MSKVETHYEISPEDKARSLARWGDWQGVGKVLGIRVFTSNPRDWSEEQREIVALALGISAGGSLSEADSSQAIINANPLYGPSIFHPIVCEIEASIKRRRARKIRGLNAGAMIIEGEFREVETTEISKPSQLQGE
jgi:hypothetical protein